MYGSFWPTVYHVSNLIRTRDELREENLDRILDLGRKANATDARDKIYGLLGLLPSTITSVIIPNYDAANTMSNVYEQFANALLQGHNRVDLALSWCSYDSNNPCPSWIPNWTTEFPRNHVKWLKQRKASGSTLHRKAFSTVGNILGTRGFIVDHVASASASPSENIAYRADVKNYSAPPTCSTFSHRYGDQKKLSAALRRTLTMDHPSIRESEDTILDIYWVDWEAILNAPEDNTYVPFWKAMHYITRNLWWETFDRFRQTNAEFSIFGQKLREFFPTTQGRYSEQHLTVNHAHDMLLSVIALLARKLITTKSGYLGLAPEQVQKDDLVAILFGCNFPVILRPSGQHYIYIGECYIDGIMNGELINPSDREPYEEVDIAIC
jgi:hypothetical protein